MSGEGLDAEVSWWDDDDVGGAGESPTETGDGDDYPMTPGAKQRRAEAKAKQLEWMLSQPPKDQLRLELASLGGTMGFFQVREMMEKERADGKWEWSRPDLPGIESSPRDSPRGKRSGQDGRASGLNEGSLEQPSMMSRATKLTHSSKTTRSSAGKKRRGRYNPASKKAAQARRARRARSKAVRVMSADVKEAMDRVARIKKDPTRCKWRALSATGRELVCTNKTVFHVAEERRLEFCGYHTPTCVLNPKRWRVQAHLSKPCDPIRPRFVNEVGMCMTHYKSRHKGLDPPRVGTDKSIPGVLSLRKHREHLRTIVETARKQLDHPLAPLDPPPSSTEDEPEPPETGILARAAEQVARQWRSAVHPVRRWRYKSAAALAIQTLWRRRRHRRAIEKRRRDLSQLERHAAALRIQQVYRGYLSRTRSHEMRVKKRACAIRLQRFARLMAFKRAVRMVVERVGTAKTLQRFARRYLFRRGLQLVLVRARGRLNARKKQERIEQIRDRIAFERRADVAARKLFRYWQGRQGRKLARLRRSVFTWAANGIGEWYAGSLERTKWRAELARSRAAATRIQSVIRILLAKAKFLRVCIKKTSAAIVIQSWFRGYVGKRGLRLLLDRRENNWRWLAWARSKWVKGRKREHFSHLLPSRNYDDGLCEVGTLHSIERGFVYQHTLRDVNDEDALLLQFLVDGISYSVYRKRQLARMMAREKSKQSMLMLQVTRAVRRHFEALAAAEAAHNAEVEMARKIWRQKVASPPRWSRLLQNEARRSEQGSANSATSASEGPSFAVVSNNKVCVAALQHRYERDVDAAESHAGLSTDSDTTAEPVGPMNRSTVSGEDVVERHTIPAHDGHEAAERVESLATATRSAMMQPAAEEVDAVPASGTQQVASTFAVRSDSIDSSVRPDQCQDAVARSSDATRPDERVVRLGARATLQVQRDNKQTLRRAKSAQHSRQLHFQPDYLGTGGMRPSSSLDRLGSGSLTTGDQGAQQRRIYLRQVPTSRLRDRRHRAKSAAASAHRQRLAVLAAARDSMLDGYIISLEGENVAPYADKSKPEMPAVVKGRPQSAIPSTSSTRRSQVHNGTADGVTDLEKYLDADERAQLHRSTQMRARSTRVTTTRREGTDDAATGAKRLRHADRQRPISALPVNSRSRRGFTGRVDPQDTTGRPPSGTLRRRRVRPASAAPADRRVRNLSSRAHYAERRSRHQDDNVIVSADDDAESVSTVSTLGVFWGKPRRHSRLSAASDEGVIVPMTWAGRPISAVSHWSGSDAPSYVPEVAGASGRPASAMSSLSRQQSISDANVIRVKLGPQRRSRAQSARRHLQHSNSKLAKATGRPTSAALARSQAITSL